MVANHLGMQGMDGQVGAKQEPSESQAKELCAIERSAPPADGAFRPSPDYHQAYSRPLACCARVTHGKCMATIVAVANYDLVGGWVVLRKALEGG